VNPPVQLEGWVRGVNSDGDGANSCDSGLKIVLGASLDVTAALLGGANIGRVELALAVL